jgi:hypothetical protein
MLKIFLALLPYLLAILGRLQGLHSQSLVDFSVINKYYIFQARAWPLLHETSETSSSLRPAALRFSHPPSCLQVQHAGADMHDLAAAVPWPACAQMQGSRSFQSCKHCMHWILYRLLLPHPTDASAAFACAGA